MDINRQAQLEGAIRMFEQRLFRGPELSESLRRTYSDRVAEMRRELQDDC